MLIPAGYPYLGLSGYVFSVVDEGDVFDQALIAFQVYHPWAISSAKSVFQPNGFFAAVAIGDHHFTNVNCTSGYGNPQLGKGAFIPAYAHYVFVKPPVYLFSPQQGPGIALGYYCQSGSLGIGCLAKK